MYFGSCLYNWIHAVHIICLYIIQSNFKTKRNVNCSAMMMMFLVFLPHFLWWQNISSKIKSHLLDCFTFFSVDLMCHVILDTPLYSEYFALVLSSCLHRVYSQIVWRPIMTCECGHAVLVSILKDRLLVYPAHPIVGRISLNVTGQCYRQSKPSSSNIFWLVDYLWWWDDCNDL